ncbi:hypothetical protein EMMF5_004559 [Cystobasidiomycetes sp. EMM_F5]
MSNEQPERVTSGGSDESHLTKSGEPDKRFKEHGGGSHGSQGQSYESIGDGSSSLRTETQPDDDGPYKPKLHDGKKQDGSDDSRVSSEHGFGGDRQRASESGQKGGSASYENGGLTN